MKITRPRNWSTPQGQWRCVSLKLMKDEWEETWVLVQPMKPMAMKAATPMKKPAKAKTQKAMKPQKL